jgi:superfamily I DNA/RNA helicase
MAHFGVEQDLPEDADMDFAWEAVMTIYSESIKTCGKIIDFDDQIFAPLMFNCRFFRNDWVLIDECQDINPARRELAKRLLKPTGRLLAVGDSRQAIYGFTGAGGDSVEKIIEEFGCARLPLTVTYRCPKAVVSYVHQWVDHIQAHEDAPEGVVRDVAFSPDPKPCRACLGTGISLGHVKTCSACDGAKLSPAEPWFQQDAPGAKDVILCRYTAPLIRNAFAMLRAGVACKVEGRDIGNNLIALASQWKVKSLDALQKRVEQWQVAQVAKAQAKNSERQEQDINDRVATLMVFIERCREKGVHTVEGLIVEIKSIFADNVKGVMTLSTIHKAKGREWPRVYWLQGPIRGRNLQEWEMAQELNMKYVAGTRAQAELILVPEAL